jgi:hypothetical protein
LAIPKEKEMTKIDLSNEEILLINHMLTFQAAELMGEMKIISIEAGIIQILMDRDIGTSLFNKLFPEVIRAVFLGNFIPEEKPDIKSLAKACPFVDYPKCLTECTVIKELQRLASTMEVK